MNGYQRRHELTLHAVLCTVSTYYDPRNLIFPPTSDRQQLHMQR
jgi:hypothetical protein